MKHKVSKFKIKSGQDANQMLLKKLVRNFAANGYITTTKTKGSYLVARLQHLAGEALKDSNSAFNELLGVFSTQKGVIAFKDSVKLHVKTGSASGCVKMLKFGERFGDAASMVKVVWTNDAEVPEAKVNKTEKKLKTEEVKDDSVKE